MATIPNQTQSQGQPHTQSQSAATGFQTAAPYTSRTPGLAFDRHFTRPGISPYDEIVWELRDAVIQDFKGKTIF
jgi:ribonucleoside-diphosphate reductase alpha chain